MLALGPNQLGGAGGGVKAWVLRRELRCIKRLANHPEQLTAFFEIPADELVSKAVADPYAAVRIDRPAAPTWRYAGASRDHRSGSG